MDPNVIMGLLDSVDAAWVTARAGSAGIDDVVGLAASVFAGAVLGWMGLLTVLTAAARIPGLAGRAAAKTAVRLAPSVVTGLVRAGVGLTVVATPAMVTMPAAAAAGVPVSAHDADDSEDLATAALPGVGRPGDAPVRAELVGATNSKQPDSRKDGRSGRATTPDAVVVAPGDCLWTIAARAIGPSATDAEIAATWPRWYARNRGVVGADPDLLIPGTVLRPPA
jgi:resuscitation-promoting factor RpfA